MPTTSEILTSPAFFALLVGEVMFWVLIAAGLGARYLLHRPRLGAWLMSGTVLVDLAILGVAVVDLHRGGTATVAHGLAALYIGFSLSFGPSLVRSLDVRAAHRWADGPAPTKVEKHGPARQAHEWAHFGRWVLTAAIAAALLGLLHLAAAAVADLTALTPWFTRLGLITAIWLVVGPLWDPIWRTGSEKARDRVASSSRS